MSEQLKRRKKGFDQTFPPFCRHFVSSDRYLQANLTLIPVDLASVKRYFTKTSHLHIYVLYYTPISKKPVQENLERKSYPFQPSWCYKLSLRSMVHSFYYLHMQINGNQTSRRFAKKTGGRLLEELELGVQPLLGHLVLVTAVENLVDSESMAQTGLGGRVHRTFSCADGLRAPVQEEQGVGLAAVIPDILSPMRS